MKTGFPPDAPFRPDRADAGWVLVWLCIGLVCGIAAYAIVKFRRETRRPPRPSDLWGWFGILLAAPLCPFLIMFALREYVLLRGEFPGVLAVAAVVTPVAWLLAWVGLFAGHFRFRRRTEPSPIMGVVACYCCLVGSGVWWIWAQVSTAHPAERGWWCKGCLKQIGLGLADYVQQYGVYPLAATGDPPVSWRVELLPFPLVDERQLHDQYDRSHAWDDVQNLPVARKNWPGYECPGNPHRWDQAERAFTDYVVLTGPGTIFPADRRLATRHITDGMTHTILAVEASGLNVVWTEPRDFDVVRQPIGINLIGKGRTDSPGMMSSYHRGGAHSLMADGSVRFISENVAPKVLKTLTTIAGGERVSEF